jgi:ParB-like chromosome segregation protein Spo0J
MAGLFPLPTEEEYRQLKNDIAARGQLVPAWVYEGKLIDGRSRARACKELGLELLIRDWDGRGSLVAFVVSLNLHRRHLTESQRALVAARLKPMFEAEAKQRMQSGKAPDPMANLPQGPARDQAAAIMGVSPRTVEAGSKVLKQGTPELIQGVETGQVSVSAASDLAELSPDEQRETVAGGKKAVAAKSKQLRQKKAGRRPAKKASDPKPGTGKHEASHPDNEKPNANDEASATTDGILIRKSDKVTKIARALIDCLGAERAAKLGTVLRERTGAPAEPAAAGAA